MTLLGDIRPQLEAALGQPINEEHLEIWANTWKRQGVPDWVSKNPGLLAQVQDRLAKSILADCLTATGASVRKIGTVIAQHERNGSWTVTLTDGTRARAKSRREVQGLAKAHFDAITGKDIGIGIVEWRT